ncbi:YozE family protein [Streptomyces sp. ERV7]|uniref:YozE family protein n=1 Tax=Streptomyces sp. ERV7 TaxID=1322334 RepID=UPI00099F8E1F|nr:YozE family protein [Streptomyces sp. ERV7]
MPQPKSFTVWLKTHTDQDNAIGDLARDISRDPDWPSRKSLPGQRTYLEERGAIPTAIETLERAWTQYEQYKAAQHE